MSPDRRGLVLAAAGLVLAGCGFRPMYGRGAGGGGAPAADLAFVAISSIPNRSGQLVRNELLVLFDPLGSAPTPQFRLDVRLEENQEGLALQSDDSATRVNLRLDAGFVLRDLRVDTDVLKGRTRAIAAYSLVRSDYANLVSQKDARQRAAVKVAEGIRTQVAIYFSRLRDGSTAG